MDRSAVRAARLAKSYAAITSGNTNISPHLGPLFLEAFYSQPNPVECVTNLADSKAGLSALQTAIRYDLSPKFFNSHATAVLQYLQDDELRVINNGLFLADIIAKIANPPTFWIEFRKAFLQGSLNEAAIHSFVWFLLQLCTLPPSESARYRQDANIPAIMSSLHAASSTKTVALAAKIEDCLNDAQFITSIDKHIAVAGPGGRHDNDFADFRQISILPTRQELQSKDQPFIRPASILEDPVTESARVAIHLDNQFRLLREDMLFELREEIQIVTIQKEGYHKGFKIQGFKLIDIDFGKEKSSADWGLVFQCKEKFPEMKDLKDEQMRKDYLSKDRNFFKHQSLACLLDENEFVAFLTINRDEDRLAKNPPEIVLQFANTEGAREALYTIKTRNDLTLVQINTAVFAYEPILKALQRAKTLPMASELLFWKKGDVLEEVSEQPISVIRALRSNPQANLKNILSMASDIHLDTSQAKSLISGLTQKVSLIHGPPGTQKSFLGALLAKVIHDHTNQRILVVSCTNHALGDIMTNLLDTGVPQSSIVILGNKFTSKTEPSKMEWQHGSPRDCSAIDELKGQLHSPMNATTSAFQQYFSTKIDYIDILDYLELEDPAFYAAFRLPESGDGMQIAGVVGIDVGPDYLIQCWSSGKDTGSFHDSVSRHQTPDSKPIWSLSITERQDHMDRWKDALLQETIQAFCDNAQEYSSCYQQFDGASKSDAYSSLQLKRILGCTATAAAIYHDEIQGFNPNILLIEEAGEILESYVLTSLGSETSQMILIGDHKRLRPKINSYLLSVEKGAGYDLNRSLFERLILKEYPRKTLSQQHRMRPEISSLIRDLTYPKLIDAPKTQGRPNLLGVQDNIIFIHHENLEDTDSSLVDKNDLGSLSSKQNSFEVSMIFKIVKYLAQQGYETDKLVILTPYLGQLQLLKLAFKEANGPVLNDLDSTELIRAGFANPEEGRLGKNPIHIFTIDNYQGGENDIVIVSLTRSNPQCDIGFMSSPRRLNVLLSRARNALIMIGNANTFKHAQEGKELWKKLFDLLGGGKHMYQGFPVKCQRHPGTESVLKDVISFETSCPEGGCTLPCGAKLSCGHLCPSKCHNLVDHSKMKCMKMQSSECTNHHPQIWPCSAGLPKTCYECESLTKFTKEKQQQDLTEKSHNEVEQQAHLERVDSVKKEIEQVHILREKAGLAIERNIAIKQREADLESSEAANVKTSTLPIVSPMNASYAPSLVSASSAKLVAIPTLVNNLLAPSLSSSPIPAEASFFGKILGTVSAAIQPVIHLPLVPQKSQKSEKLIAPMKPSSSEKEWRHIKNAEGMNCNSIDAIMDMTGLEAIKEQVLKVKANIDTSRRQGASLKSERFNVVFLGNPGTGKTTVARHYAKFLADVKAIPGVAFIETTGARLAQEGVDKAKKLIKSAINAGGGAIFVDEAYQLTNGNSHGGPAVLDFLLAEMENSRGTLVFILAGYSKEMEKFFEHNPGLKSRIPYQFTFNDYKDEELMAMFKAMVEKTYSGKMIFEDGIEGLYTRIAIRRLGRRRGRPGFGNARDLEQMFARIRGRQATRLTKARKEGSKTDDFFMSREDLIGPDPATAILESESWKKLQTLIGLKSVKESVQSFFSLIEENYQRELQEKEPIEMSLNRVFFGSPGTGKTSVAKLYGQILADLGLLTNGEVVTKNPADFQGAVLGASEANTKAILANTIGKVLIIDEAYMLHGGGGKDGGSSNQYKTSVIDTIVAEVQNVPGEDRCLLMLGYKDQMIEMFQNVNPGLSRRFKIEDAFNFEDFSDVELLQILDLKLKSGDLDATDSAKKVALEHLIRMRNRPNFGNAGEVENIITQAKARCVARRAKLPAADRPLNIVFEPQDFDPDFDRGATAAANLIKLFDDIVGCEDIIERLKSYQELALVCKKSDKDPRELIPMNFVFTGPPGTGKTTVARKIGQVFYDMGILGSTEVVECSASDLVGQYVGQTGPKTKMLFEKALGKVLFIDEAYRLSEGHFAQEAIDELVGLLTHPSFKSKLIVILAGYEHDINRLLSVNAGLSSRFPDQVVFRNMDPGRCMDILRKELGKNKVNLDNLDDRASTFYVGMKGLIQEMSQLKDWGNARDMITLSKALASRALLSLKDLPAGAEARLSASEVLDITKNMLQDRQQRSKGPEKPQEIHRLPKQNAAPTPPMPSPASATTSSAAAPPRAQAPTSPQQQQPQRTENQGKNASNEPQSPATPAQPMAPTRPVAVPVQPIAPTKPVVPSQPVAPTKPVVPTQSAAPTKSAAPSQPVASTKPIVNTQPVAPTKPVLPAQSVPPTTPAARNNPVVPTQPVTAAPNKSAPAQAAVTTQPGVQRDPGVTDKVWQEISEAKRAAEVIAEQAKKEQRELERKFAEQKQIEETQSKKKLEMEQALVAEKDPARRADLQRQCDEARRLEEAARGAKQKVAEQHRARKEAESLRQDAEQKAQQKLRQMGVCAAGYQWVRLGSVYRCAGGTHSVLASALGL